MPDRTPEDFSLQAYDYDLPEQQIARFPAAQAASSRLLVLPRDPEAGREKILHRHFHELPDLLPQNALVVANNTRVLPARLAGKAGSGGRREFLLLTPLPLVLADARPRLIDPDAEIEQLASAECLIRPSSRTHAGDVIQLAPGLDATVLSKENFGKHRVELRWKGDLESIFTKYGQLPLPPYLRREPVKEDDRRYQTVYARDTGAVAAPTAGLHFTPQLLDEMKQKGFEWCEICLHVGYGTFSPVRCADIRKHEMHAEYVQITADAAARIRTARAEGRKIVAVGTTSLRALEGVFQAAGEIEEFSGWVNIFLFPGRPFRIVDALITNFHLPRSTLLMLVSAFAGRERILRAYSEALQEGYKFFSYGDAMLISDR